MKQSFYQANFHISDLTYMSQAIVKPLSLSLSVAVRLHVKVIPTRSKGETFNENHSCVLSSRSSHLFLSLVSIF